MTPKPWSINRMTMSSGLPWGQPPGMPGWRGLLPYLQRRGSDPLPHRADERGRFGSTTVLSSAGIATMHAPTAAEARGGSYGMGWWVNGQLGGVPAIFHDGDNANFHTLLLIEPETRWGAILLVNANSAMPIDAGNSPLPLQSLQDGVARPLAGQAPQASLSLTTFYLIFNGVLAVLLAIFPLLRLRRRSRRFGQRRHRVVRLARSPLARRPAVRQ